MSIAQSLLQRFIRHLLPRIHDARVALGSATGVAETAMGGSVSMRTSKVLVGSAMAIAAAMQIGVGGGIASAADGESLGIAAAALDGDNLKVDVLYTCPAGAKHKMLSVLAEELDKDGKVVTSNVGSQKLVITEYDEDKKENVEKPGCDGEPQRLTVTIEPDDGMKWTKGAMGNVTVSFSDDIEFNAKQSNLKFVAG